MLKKRIGLQMLKFESCFRSMFHRFFVGSTCLCFVIVPNIFNLFNIHLFWWTKRLFVEQFPTCRSTKRPTRRTWTAHLFLLLKRKNTQQRLFGEFASTHLHLTSPADEILSKKLWSRWVNKTRSLIFAPRPNKLKHNNNNWTQHEVMLAASHSPNAHW